MTTKTGQRKETDDTEMNYNDRIGEALSVQLQLQVKTDINVIAALLYV